MASLRSQVPRPESDSERRDASTDGSLNLTASTFELGFLVGAKGSSGGFMCASSFAAEALDNPELSPVVSGLKGVFDFFGAYGYQPTVACLWLNRCSIPACSGRSCCELALDVVSMLS